MMNKTRLLLLSAACAALVGGVVAYLCLRSSSDAYAQALPSDATAIVRLDATAFLHDADFSLKDLLHLQEELTSSTGEGGEGLGIDWKRPVYAFASASGNMGLVAAVDDEKELSAFCQSRGAEVARQRGYAWAVVEQQWLLAFDSEKALVMGPAVGAAQEQLRNEMAGLLEQKRDASGLVSPLFEALGKNPKPLSAVCAPEILPAEVRQFLRRFKVATKDDALLLMDLEAEDNELELEANVLPGNDDVRAGLRRMDELLRPVEGALTEYSHAGNLAWMVMNVEGTTLLDVLRSDANVRTALLALNLTFDLDRMIRSVDGDVALELTDAPSVGSLMGMELPFGGFQIAARVADTAFLRDAPTWGSALMGVQALSPQDFALNFGASSLYFGVEDQTLYIGGERGLAHEGNGYLRRNRDDIKDCRFYATVSVPDLLRHVETQVQLPPAFAQMERLDLEMERTGEFKLKLVAPEGTNIARVLLLNR